LFILVVLGLQTFAMRLALQMNLVVFGLQTFAMLVALQMNQNWCIKPLDTGRVNT